MLKKIIPFIFAALTLALTPTQSASAWERVCVHLPLFDAWYSTRFFVIHTFNKTPGKLPNKVLVSRSGHRPTFNLPNFGHLTESDRNARPAEGRKDSPQFDVNQTRCESIKNVPNGEPFFVYITPYLGWGSSLCETHPSNPNPWYEQQDSRYRDLVYHAWGTTGNAKCAFKYER